MISSFFLILSVKERKPEYVHLMGDTDHRNLKNYISVPKITKISFFENKRMPADSKKKIAIE